MAPKRNAETSIEERALKILRDADFFGKLRSIISRCGLVGEIRNALALYIVAISSLLLRPLCAILKGGSSAGKNILARKVLRLLPDTAVREITSSSKTAWNYSGDDFRNCVVYIQERNDGTGNIHPIRLLISEGKLIRTVTVRKKGQITTETFVANGPIAAITTTTKDRLEIDDETRSISLWLDESDEQTRRIMEGDVSAQPELPQGSEEEVKTWHKVYDLISARSRIPIELPEWFKKIPSMVFASDIRVRRYFPAFLSAVRIIALIRSFEQHPEAYATEENISVTFADYAIATYIFNDVFGESLSRGECLETSKTLATIAATQGGEPVAANQFAEVSGISYDKASAKLRAALDAGLVKRANNPEKNNNKRYLPVNQPRFVPDPREVASEVPEPKKPVTFFHPLTGRKIEFGGK